MKTQKQYSKSPKLKTLMKFGSLITVALMLFSCGKNNSNNNNNNGYWGYQNGMVGGQTFFTSQSTDTSNRLAISLNFMGNTGYYNQGYNPYNQMNSYNQMPYGYGYGYNYNSPIVSYQGQTVVTGQMQIMQTLGNWGCMIPAGTYTVQTVQPGQWNSAIVTGLSLVAMGPAQIMLSIPQAQVSAKGSKGATWSETAPMGRLFGNLMIQSVNGMACQMSTLIQ